MIELEIVDVRIEETTKQPYMELRPLDGSQRILPIFIGPAEAAAIKLALDNKVPQRPMTHDLFVASLAEAGASIDQVVVVSFERKTFFAELHLSVVGTDGPERKVLSCRPSDGVALVLRCGASLFANDAVLDECAVPDLAALAEDQPDGDDDVAPLPDDVVVDEFRRFIDDVKPEDFA